MIKAHLTIDAKGLSCPMPIVKTKQAMNDLAEGEVMEVQATDAGSTADIEAWAESAGHQYIGTLEKDGVLFHYLRKGERDQKIDQTFVQVISNEEILKRDGCILDVREAAEYAFGHIEGAKSIPLGELKDRLDELDPNEAIYVICRTGNRSDLAARILTEHGFKHVYNVLPGMTKWNGKLVKEI